MRRLFSSKIPTLILFTLMAVLPPPAFPAAPPPLPDLAQPLVHDGSSFDRELIIMGAGAVAGVTAYNYAVLGPVAAFPYLYGESMVSLPVWVGATRVYTTASAVLGVLTTHWLYHGWEDFFPRTVENPVAGR
ncbi:MAG: hypothetical protein WCP34_12040 [Pseudomonadota bacterium]